MLTAELTQKKPDVLTTLRGIVAVGIVIVGTTYLYDRFHSFLAQAGDSRIEPPPTTSSNDQITAKTAEVIKNLQEQISTPTAPSPTLRPTNSSTPTGKEVLSVMEKAPISARVDALLAGNGSKKDELIIRLALSKNDGLVLESLKKITTRKQAISILTRYRTDFEENPVLDGFLKNTHPAISVLDRVIKKVLSAQELKGGYVTLDPKRITDNVVIVYASEPGGGANWEPDLGFGWVIYGPYSKSKINNLNKDYAQAVIVSNVAHEAIVHPVQSGVINTKPDRQPQLAGKIIHTFMGVSEDIARQTIGISFQSPDAQMLIALKRAESGGLTPEKAVLTALRIGFGKIDEIPVLEGYYERGRLPTDPSFYALMAVEKPNQIPVDPGDEYYSKVLNHFRKYWDKIENVRFTSY